MDKIETKDIIVGNVISDGNSIFKCKKVTCKFITCTLITGDADGFFPEKDGTYMFCRRDTIWSKLSTTKVVFRKWRKEGDIIALFPEQTDPKKLTVGSYMHVGQHSDADYNAIISETVPASETEYADLLSELKRIGYDGIKVVRRCKPKYEN